MYVVVFTAGAAESLARLGKNDQRRVKRALLALSNAPRSTTAKKLADTDDLWRIRARDYRVIYAIEDATLIVLVVKIGHRKDVYR